MIKFENAEVAGWEAAIRGMRNPLNSWDKSDSEWDDYPHERNAVQYNGEYGFYIGDNDLNLMQRLRSAGTDHRKFLRMIVVYVDISAPLYWWKEFDTYKVGTVANSCSTMHKIADKEFTLDDFSHEHLFDDYSFENQLTYGDEFCYTSKDALQVICDVLNHNRFMFLNTKDKRYWWQMIQLLPSSYNQKRTVLLNYEVLNNIYKSRKNHKLDEWAQHEGVIDGGRTNKEYIGFCDWIETLPYAKELIIGEN